MNIEEFVERYSSRFRHHPPKNDDVASNHHSIRQACLALAEDISFLVPKSREQSLALTKVEEAMMWANAGIARHQ